MSKKQELKAHRNNSQSTALRDINVALGGGRLQSYFPMFTCPGVIFRYTFFRQPVEAATTIEIKTTNVPGDNERPPGTGIYFIWSPI